MQLTDPIYTAQMTPHQRAWFYAEFEQASRNEVVGVLLALFLGCFGIHHFYLRRNGLGLLYLVFSWTGVPAVLGFIEAFFMPGRVRHYNAMQAGFIAGQIMGGQNVGGAPAFYPAAASPTVACSACGGTVADGAGFCPHCGAALAARA
jgi:TM2 domain-containing membrane protein YozV